MAVVDGNYSKKMRISGDEVVGVARRVVSRLTSLLPKVDNQENYHADEEMDELVLDMQHFRKNCKKRKQSRGHNEEESIEAEMLEEKKMTFVSAKKQNSPAVKVDEAPAAALVPKKSSIMMDPTFFRKATSLMGMFRMEEPARNNSLFGDDDLRMDFEDNLNLPVPEGLDFNNLLEASFNFHSLTSSRDLGISTDLFPQFNL